mmetsp:Transcript_6967/g.26044  ORF Transcript_6967/g.26044 Transcript_6967/m.26044 type:complete len:911 (-) Transcript_6967:908-3640(-)
MSLAKTRRNGTSSWHPIHYELPYETVCVISDDGKNNNSAENDTWSSDKQLLSGSGHNATTQLLNHLIPNKQTFLTSFKSPHAQLTVFETLRHEPSSQHHLFKESNATTGKDSSSTLASQLQQLSRLTQTQQKLTNLQHDASTLIQHCLNIQSKAQFVTHQTEQFEESCGALVRKIEQLEMFAAGIREKLAFFDDMERFQQILNRSLTNGAASGVSLLQAWRQQLKQRFFKDQLAKLDDSISFLEQHPQYKESERYLNRYRHLKNRALACVRDFVVASFKDVGTRVGSSLSEAQRALEQKRLEATSDEVVVTPSDDGKEADQSLTIHHSMELDLEEQQHSLLYIEFQSEVDHLLKPIELIELRCEPSIPASFNDDTTSTSSITSLRSTKSSALSPNEYLIFLQDCFDAYHHQRRVLVQPIIEKRISDLVDSGELIQVVRNGCSIIIQIAMHESKLYSRLFHSSLLRNSYRNLIQSLCNILYEQLRSVVIHEDSIEVLGSCVEILRKEILRDAVRPKRDLLRFVEPVIHHMVQDVQERLIFRSSMYIRENIQLFKPTDSDLNYPHKLMQKGEEKGGEELNNQTGATETSPPPMQLEDTTPVGDDDDNLSFMYSDWYPPLPRSLNLLSKLYNRIEIGVFEGLAQEIISLCTDAFIDASPQIAQKSSVLDGELFLIKHLLALRMELTPFEKLNFTTVEASLDFSHVKEGIKRFLKGQATFRMKNLIFDIMSHSQPRIIHTSVDSKKDLEKRLKIVYDSFILNVTRLCFDDLMIHVKKTHAEVVSRAVKQQDEGDQAPPSSSDSTLDVYNKSIENLKNVLATQLTPKMKLYIEHQKTQMELFKGIKLSLLGVYKTFLSQILNAGKSTDDLLSIEQLSALIETYQPSLSGEEGNENTNPMSSAEEHIEETSGIMES